MKVSNNCVGIMNETLASGIHDQDTENVVINNSTPGDIKFIRPASIVNKTYNKGLTTEKIAILRENLPDYLINNAQFGLINAFESRDMNGNVSIKKIPCNAFGSAVSGFENGKSFDEVAVPNPNVSHVSLVLPRESNKYIAIGALDIDHCLDENGNFDPSFPHQRFLDAIINSKWTYMEYSMSRTGAHIIFGVEGGKPDFVKKTRNDRCELYFEKHVIALTGNRIPGSLKQITIIPQEYMGSFYELLGFKIDEQTSVNKVSHHVNGECSHKVYKMVDNPTIDYVMSELYNGRKTRELLCGDWHLYYKSKSDADIGLAWYAALHSNCDENIIKEVMYRSNLYSEDLDGKNKWDRDDYFNGTINKAIDLVCKKNPDMLRLVEERKQQGNGVN